MKITILTETDLRKCVGVNLEAIAAVENAFTLLADGKAIVPPIVGVEIPEHNGELDIKTAYIQGLDSFAIKFAGGFYDNDKLGLPTSSGMMVLVSAVTGFPQAAMFDNGYLTQVRTGAAGAIAAKYLAKKDIDTVGVIGSGTQARYQIHALRHVRPFKRLLVYGIVPEEVGCYVNEMAADLGIEVLAVKDAETLVRRSDVVVTTTPSHHPIVRAEWLHPGLHITAMGSDGPDKEELFPEVLARADRMVCDRKSQCAVRGELHHALEKGLLSESSPVIELGELTSGRKPGRQSEGEITVCDLTGVGVQDTAIALLAHQKAEALGLGFTMEV